MDEKRATKCVVCSQPVTFLDTFPGDLCLNCYRQTPEANAPITADALVAAFRGVVEK
jgi:hypothetical protein